MGAFLGGLAEGLAGSITDQIKQKHQEDLDKKQELLQFYTNAFLQGNATDVTQQELQQNILKLLGPDAKKSFKQSIPLLGPLSKFLHLNRQQGGQQQQQQQQPGQPQQPVAPPDQGQFAAPPSQTAAAAAPAPDQTASPQLPPTAAFKVGPPGVGGAEPYTTPLDEVAQGGYQDWVAQLDPNLRNTEDYDLQGAYVAGAKPEAGHLTDEFKKPNHITFSDKSKYNNPATGEVGGKWVTNPDGTYTFYASPFNLKQHSAKDLQEYFDREEVPRGNKLVLPKAAFAAAPTATGTAAAPRTAAAGAGTAAGAGQTPRQRFDAAGQIPGLFVPGYETREKRAEEGLVRKGEIERRIKDEGIQENLKVLDQMGYTAERAKTDPHVADVRMRVALGQQMPTERPVADKVKRGIERPGIDPETGKAYTGKWNQTRTYDQDTGQWEETWDRVATTPKRQRVFLRYPGEKAGDPIHGAIQDLNNPKDLVDNRGDPVPEGAQEITQAQLSQEVRGRSYGVFGQFYNSALSKPGTTEQQALQEAGERTQAWYEKEYELKGAPRFHEVLGFDQAGQPVFMSLRSGAIQSGLIPQTLPGGGAAPGVTPKPAAPTPPGQPPTRPPAAGPAGGPPAAATTPGTTPPAKPPQTVAQNVAPVPAPRTGTGIAPGTRPAPGMTGPMVSTRQRIMTQSLPIVEAATQIFGDPQDPNFKGLDSFAHLADDPKSRDRLQSALAIAWDMVGEAESASISAGAGPVHFETGGIGQLVEYAFGIPGDVAKQKAKTLEKAVEKLTPEEKEYFVRMISARGSIAGLRTLTKTPGAISLLRNIEAEMPKIGYPVSDSTTYYNQLENLSKSIEKAKQYTVEWAFDPETAKWISGLSSKVQQARAATQKAAAQKGGPPATAPAAPIKLDPPQKGAKLTDPNIAAEFQRQAGGDKAKARQLALARGWTL